tara:strand:- start:133 stop:459 length:327 start_codon:yes stop_codon:yes gene_type:complete
MAFEKNNKFGKGRPKGSKNSNSKEIREMITQIVADNLDETKQRLSNLKDADYFKAMGMLMKHVLPQQKQIEQNTFDHPTNFQIEIIDRIDQVRDDNTLDKVIDLMANE